MCDAEFRHISCPQRLEMICKANLSSAIHFRRFAVQLGQRDLRSSGRVCHRNLKFEATQSTEAQSLVQLDVAHFEFNIELIFEKIVHAPAFSEPLRSFLVGLEAEPVRARFFVVLNVLKRARTLIEGTREEGCRRLFTLISAWYSSLSRCGQRSLSRGPAFVCSRGIVLNVFRVPASTILTSLAN